MTETTGQLTLPTTTDGRMPAGMKTKISGAGQRITRPHALGDTVVLVLEGKIKSAGHEETNDGVLYVEAIATKDLFELSDAIGKPVLAALRQAARQADGESPMPGMGTEPVEEAVRVIVDGSGVVMTPTEVAEAQGRKVAAEFGPEDPVVLQFEGGERGLWPDDWAGLGQSRADLGGIMRLPGSTKVGETGRVVAFIDHVTGETIGTWEALLAALEDDPEYRAAVEAEAAEVAAQVEEAKYAEADPDEAGPFDVEVDEGPGDDVEYVEDADGFAEPAPPAAAEEGAEVLTGPWSGSGAAIEHLPEPADFTWVDRQVKDLKPKVADLTDRDHVLRLLKAEEQGRGRDLKPRKGVIEMLTKRAAELYSDLADLEAPDLNGDDLEVPEDAEVDSFEPEEV